MVGNLGASCRAVEAPEELENGEGAGVRLGICERDSWPDSPAVGLGVAPRFEALPRFDEVP